VLGVLIHACASGNATQVNCPKGNAIVDAHIAEDGTVDEAKLEFSTGSSELDEAALATVKKWRFTPVPGRSAATWTKLVVKFDGRVCGAAGEVRTMIDRQPAFPTPDFQSMPKVQ
jgi:TonB family protein